MIPTRRDADFVAGQTALLFVDMQKVFALPGRDPLHPERDGEHAFHAHLRDTVIPNQRRILAAARAAGIEVLHTVIRALTQDGRDRSVDHKLSGILVARDDPDGDIIDELAPAGDEIVLPKTSSGVFNSTNIDYVLRNLGIRYLIVAGIVTDQCVDMAVRDAADRGYLVSVPRDASATYTSERHEAALRAFGGYCWLTDTDTVVRRIEALSGSAPEGHTHAAR
ncbi:cysteine hydrolase family protein [Phreatobacter cathodiphilus]|uniref:Cysteine hydrolase n=1 Tax=Phreatobacter cathodiphilus TaxID=1868589 RepID=A0A2S0NG04_9HYPH|nr:isochorismatase family cysteine hydrolase [Phreatobacter cathodiphilus]AVO47092.1 cysteine hydrolase [Phreatobacter cathodiphilus]